MVSLLAVTEYCIKETAQQGYGTSLNVIDVNGQITLIAKLPAKMSLVHLTNVVRLPLKCVSVIMVTQRTMTMSVCLLLFLRQHLAFVLERPQETMLTLRDATVSFLAATEYCITEIAQLGYGTIRNVIDVNGQIS